MWNNIFANVFIWESFFGSCGFFSDENQPYCQVQLHIMKMGCMFMYVPIPTSRKVFGHVAIHIFKNRLGTCYKQGTDKW